MKSVLWSYFHWSYSRIGSWQAWVEKRSMLSCWFEPFYSHQLRLSTEMEKKDKDFLYSMASAKLVHLLTSVHSNLCFLSPSQCCCSSLFPTNSQGSLLDCQSCSDPCGQVWTLLSTVTYSPILFWPAWLGSSCWIRIPFSSSSTCPSSWTPWECLSWWRLLSAGHST